MASYGGYTRTGYGAQGGEEGGGFMGGSQQQGSQGGATKSHADDSLRPVTIKQLVDCKEAYPGADLAIDGLPVTQVTLVGQVRSVNPQTTNVTYRIDDGTGVIDVKKWVDAEKADDPDHTDPRFAPDTYVRVWGRLTSFNGRKHVGAHCIRAVTDFNEVNYHMLEATYVHLCLTKGGPPGQQQGGGGNAAGGDAMFVDQAGYGGGGTGAGGNAGGFGSGSMAAVAACSKNAKNVFNFMANSPGGNEGLHINFIASGMGMSIRDVLSAVDELMGQGALYNTVDDETFAILDY